MKKLYVNLISPLQYLLQSTCQIYPKIKVPTKKVVTIQSILPQKPKKH